MLYFGMAEGPTPYPTTWLQQVHSRVLQSLIDVTFDFAAAQTGLPSLMTAAGGFRSPARLRGRHFFGFYQGLKAAPLANPS